MANLGCIGLGAMGSRMANRLLDKGHTSPGTTAPARRRIGPLCGSLREFCTRCAPAGMSRIAVPGARSAPKETGNQPWALRDIKGRARGWLVDRGMKWGDSPRAVTEAADVMLSRCSAVRAGRGCQDWRGVAPSSDAGLDGPSRWVDHPRCGLSRSALCVGDPASGR